jgi:dihydrofolate reductase
MADGMMRKAGAECHDDNEGRGDNERRARISLIVAAAENGVIGAGGAIPWRSSADMKYFRKTTMGKPVMMGRRTWESLPEAFRPLQGRENIVITSNRGYSAPGAHIAASPDEALNIARQLLAAAGKDGGPAAGLGAMKEAAEIMVIGGAAVYEAFMPGAQRIYYTLVRLAPRGSVFFPSLKELARKGWREISRREQRAGPGDDADLSFVILERKKAST